MSKVLKSAFAMIILLCLSAIYFLYYEEENSFRGIMNGFMVLSSTTTQTPCLFTTANVDKSLDKNFETISKPNFLDGVKTVASEKANNRFDSDVSISIHKTISNTAATSAVSHEAQRSTGPVFPPETLDKNSPFYAMLYKNDYGLPMKSNVPNPPLFRHNWEDWKLYFPDLMLSLEKFQNFNPSFDEKLFTRSAVVKHNKTNYTFGESFSATIISLDGHSKRKNFGGDYYRARLVREIKDRPADAIPCQVTDNLDGSYSVSAPLLLNGSFKLEVKLVIPLEGIWEIISKTENMITWRMRFVGVLKSGENITCNLELPNRTKDSPVCDYSNPRNKEPWLCEVPSSKNCSKIVSIEIDRNVKYPINFSDICLKYGCRILIGSNETIFVKSEKISTATEPLSTCDKRFKKVENDSIRNVGFFQNSTWNSLICHHSMTSFSLAKTRVTNKIIYFLGDSTIRQFFSKISFILQLKIRGPNSRKILQQPKIAQSGAAQNRNITMYYRAHGLPLRNFGPSDTRQYISDSISNILAGGKNVVVILNLGAHFYQHHPRFYLHRLDGIKRAIAEHHKNFPETRFIVKGLNVVEDNEEWCIYRLNKLLQKKFSNIKNVVYLDLWAFTTVWPLNNYHPSGEAQIQQTMYLLSYI